MTKRIDIIGQNGNDGLVYSNRSGNKCSGNARKSTPSSRIETDYRDTGARPHTPSTKYKRAKNRQEVLNELEDYYTDEFDE